MNKVDADGDTVMAPTRTGGDREKCRGDRKSTAGKQRAKWVDVTERDRRRENRLCFRCGALGHRIREYPYALATQPTSINATRILPLLEDDGNESDPPLLKRESNAQECQTLGSTTLHLDVQGRP